jgi:TrpR family trp operon transcriptional repressor
MPRLVWIGKYFFVGRMVLTIVSIYSNVPSNTRWEEPMDDLHELIDIFARTGKYEEMQKLFEELFTQREKYDFALRWRLMKELHDGKPQREIANSLGISLCKITRGSKILKTPGSLMNTILQERDHGKDN